MSAAIARHDDLLATCIAGRNGDLVKSGSRGDGALAVFARAADAISCAVDVQRSFSAEPWPEGATLRVRAAVHSGEAETRDNDYFGPTLSRAARLMSTAHGGQVVASSATIEAAKDAMPEEIEIVDLGSHQLKDLYKPERIFQIVAPGLEKSFPALVSLNARMHNLPVQLTSFVGRAGELRELETLIAGARLVTIAGVGGAGKTRLALQAAAEHAERFENGIAFIDLAPVRDQTTVPRTFVLALDVADPAVEATIDAPESSAKALTDHLVRVLRDSKMLIVADNCEHVIDASSRLIGALLASCPGLRVLATSREPIGVSGEHVYKMPPLTPPRAGDPEDVETLEACESVRLFCDRSRAARSDFELTEANSAGVADICRQLDGIPLALELAAARTNVLSPAQIARRLAEAPDLLAATGRDVVERHRTLEGVLEWSYDALNGDERVLLRRLAVFNGGWSLESAESICVAEPLASGRVLDLLSHLVDRSLVVADDQGNGVRYRLLEPVRQFAERKLVRAGEDAATRDHHRDWFVRQTGDESFVLYSSDGRLAELTPELDNFRAAMRWSLDSGDATSAMRIATPLNGVFVWLGQQAEADAWLTEALDKSDGSVSDLTASTIGTLAANLDLCGDARRGVELQRRAGAMFEALGNSSSLLWSLVYLGHGLHFCGEYEEEHEVYERALEIALEVDDKVAISLIPLLESWQQMTNGDIDTVRALSRKVLGSGEDGHAGARLGIYAFLGYCLFLEGHHEAAANTFEPAIATLLSEFVDAAGNEDPMGLWCLNVIGTLELTEESTQKTGRRRLADLLRRARRTGLLGAFPNPFDSAAALAALEGDAVGSARLFGAVDRLRRDTGIEMRYATTQEMVDRGRKAARDALGDELFDLELERGGALSLPEALDLANELLERGS